MLSASKASTQGPTVDVQTSPNIQTSQMVTQEGSRIGTLELGRSPGLRVSAKTEEARQVLILSFPGNGVSLGHGMIVHGLINSPFPSWHRRCLSVAISDFSTVKSVLNQYSVQSCHLSIWDAEAGGLCLCYRVRSRPAWAIWYDPVLK